MIECREYPRIPVDMQVFFSSTNKTDIREGTMFDLSVRGCAVTSMSLPSASIPSCHLMIASTTCRARSPA